MAKKTKKEKPKKKSRPNSTECGSGQFIRTTPERWNKNRRILYVYKKANIEETAAGGARRMSKQPELTCHSHRHSQRGSQARSQRKKNNTQSPVGLAIGVLFSFYPRCVLRHPSTYYYFMPSFSLPPHLPSKENAPQHFLSCSRSSYDNQVVSYHQRVSCRYDDYNNNHFLFLPWRLCCIRQTRKWQGAND